MLQGDQLGRTVGGSSMAVESRSQMTPFGWITLAEGEYHGLTTSLVSKAGVPERTSLYHDSVGETSQRVG
jgi:hypothetical protein